MSPFVLLALANASSYVLQMERCAGRHTLHGLWPQWAEWCPGEPYSAAALADLDDRMREWWPSCEGFRNATWFHRHEWRRHGTCSGLGLHGYFETALDLRDAYGPGAADRVCLTRDFRRVDCPGPGGSLSPPPGVQPPHPDPR